MFGSSGKWKEKVSKADVLMEGSKGHCTFRARLGSDPPAPALSHECHLPATGVRTSSRNHIGSGSGSLQIHMYVSFIPACQVDGEE